MNNLVDFAVFAILGFQWTTKLQGLICHKTQPTNQLSENEIKRKDLLRKLKKEGGSMLGTAPQRFYKDIGGIEIGGRFEIIQITALLRTTCVLRKVLET